MNNYDTLIKFTKKHNISIDIEGKIFSVLLPFQYEILLIELIVISIITVILYIVKDVPYYHITVTGDTIYSKVISSYLSRHQFNHVLCKSNNRLSYYYTEDNQRIPFEEPGIDYFKEDDMISLIPNSLEELSQIEKHTGLKNLPYVQGKVLSEFKNYQMNIVITDNIMLKNPIISIRRVFKDLYYITTIDEAWISCVIFSDLISPLQYGDIISCVCQTDSIIKCDKYTVNYDLSIKNISDCELGEESAFYSLKYPRLFSKNSFYIMHPFHFPQTLDVFVILMVMTRAILNF